MTTLLLAVLLGLCQFEGTSDQVDQAQLAKRIRENLAKVDEALLEATEADAVTDQIAQARQMHLNNIRDIEKLIESMEYQLMNPPPGGGGGGGQQGKGQGNQPKPRPSDGSSQPQGGAPDQPKPGGEEPQGSESGEQPGEQPEDGEQPGQNGRRPDEGMSDQTGDQPPPPDDLSDYTRDNTDGRWGLLPPKVQEQLNNLHVDDVPARYRDWLDAYIQAMARLEEP